MGLSAFSRARVSLKDESIAEAERFETWNQRHQYGSRLQDNTYYPEQIGTEGQPQTPPDPEDPNMPETPDTPREGIEAQNNPPVPPVVERINKISEEGRKKIGEKVIAGLAENTPENETVDLPLRIDHARDLVGRRHIEDPQGEPKDTLERLDERIPTGGEADATIVITHHTSVTAEGPTREEMEAAYEEQEPWQPDEDEQTEDAEGRKITKREERAKTQLPAAGQGAGVKGENAPSPTNRDTQARSAAVAKGPQGTAAVVKGEHGAAGVAGRTSSPAGPSKTVPQTTSAKDENDKNDKGNKK